MWFEYIITQTCNDIKQNMLAYTIDDGKILKTLSRLCCFGILRNAKAFL